MIGESREMQRNSVNRYKLKKKRRKHKRENQKRKVLPNGEKHVSRDKQMKNFQKNF